MSVRVELRGRNAGRAQDRLAAPGEQHEADALERWGGRRCSPPARPRRRLRRALLLERCEPGRSSPTLGSMRRSTSDRARCRGCGSRPASRFHTLEDEAASWAESLPREWEAPTAPFEEPSRRATSDELAPTQGEQVLAAPGPARRERARGASASRGSSIDPKPLVGEREFWSRRSSAASELGHGERDVLHRLDRLCVRARSRRERAKGWTIAQTIAWSACDYREPHIDGPAGCWRTR